MHENATCSRVICVAWVFLNARERERETPSVLYGGRGALEKLLGSILEGRKHQPKPFERAQCLPAILLSWLLHWEAGDNMAAIQALSLYVCVCVLLHDALNTRTHCVC